MKVTELKMNVQRKGDYKEVEITYRNEEKGYHYFRITTETASVDFEINNIQLDQLKDLLSSAFPHYG